MPDTKHLPENMQFKSLTLNHKHFIVPIRCLIYTQIWKRFIRLGRLVNKLSFNNAWM